MTPEQFIKDCIIRVYGKERVIGQYRSDKKSTGRMYTFKSCKPIKEVVDILNDVFGLYKINANAYINNIQYKSGKRSEKLVVFLTI